MRPLALIALALATSMATAQEPVAVRPRYTRPDSVPRRDTTGATDSTRLNDSTTRRVSKGGGGCWRAAPRPRCGGFFLTDIGVEFPLRSTRNPDSLGVTRTDFPIRGVWTFGFMGSARKHSHGLAASITSERAEHLGFNFVEYRYRNWRNASAAFDAGIGYKTNGVWEPGVGLVTGKGVTAMVGFTPTRFIGVSVRSDWLRAQHRNHHAVLFGVQSTRASEFVIKQGFVAVARELLSHIGVELEEEDP